MTHFHCKMSPEHRLVLSKNSTWFVVLGILLTCLGILAITYSIQTTILSLIFLGALLVASGIVLIADTFIFWRKQWRGFLLHLLTGLLYLVVGGLIIKGPEVASISLTLLLGVFYIFIGAFRLCYSAFLELPGHWLRVLNGIVSLFLGILIILSWPASGLFVIGLFIGIDLLFLGLSYTLGALE